MNKEEIMNLSFDAIEERAATIAAEIETADAEKIAELSEELDALEERKRTLEAEAEEARRKAEDVARGAGNPIETRKEKKMEVRNTPEYIEAFAKYIKTGKDAECRALLTENVSGGTVPVPEMVENRIRAAWKNNEIWNRIAKTYVPGNLKVGFEISATDAAIHVEGAAAPAEEELVIGVVNLVPQTIKKWITFSTEVMALGAEDFVNYVYDEIVYKIYQAASKAVCDEILAAPAASTASAVGVPAVTGTVGPDTILEAMAELGEDAQDRVIIASAATIAAVRSAALAANYAYDPFFGMAVIQNDALTSQAIIGDLSGVQANLPEGDDVKFIFDEYSLAERDLVKLVGRLYVAIKVVGPGMLAVIKSE